MAAQQMFYKWDENKAISVKSRDISYIMPKCFCEYKTWVFCKRRDLTKQQLSCLETAFLQTAFAQMPSPLSLHASLSFTKPLSFEESFTKQKEEEEEKEEKKKVEEEEEEEDGEKTQEFD